MTINESHQILTVAEIAERLRLGQRWVYEHADQLGAYRLGKYLRFDLRRVMERLAAGKIGARTLGSQPNDLLEKP
jgi:excisionase family DNA binding protein